ncbi:MAG TPA: prolipoprotein diacylglyceryl transferase family protein [Streptosporangiaceae bacterium]|jgi:prolipoprotein diacylglyceryl transferase
MSTAYIPSPAQGVWHLGPLPVRAYALCIALGVVVAVWVASARYRAVGGRPGLIIDVATWAVPLGLAGARLDSVLTDYQMYLGRHRDWTGIFRVWDGGIGLPGAIVFGFAGAWIACRRAGVRLSPVAGAAAPGIAFGQAVGRWGNWFNQELYGRPSSLPWAVQIAPAHRVSGYESFVNFQPAFLYDSLWDVAAGLLLIGAAHRFLLTGDRVFALYVAACAAGMFVMQAIRIDYAHRIAGLRVNEWIAILAFAGAAGYLYRTRHARRADPLVEPDQPAPPAGVRAAAASPADPALTERPAEG